MRNANNYPDLAGDSAPFSADVRAYLFGDLARIKTDIASIDSRINEAISEDNHRTDQVVRDVYERLSKEIRSISEHYAALASQVASTTNITSQQATQFTELQRRLSDLQVAIGVVDGLEGRLSTQFAERLDSLARSLDVLVDNKMLRQQNQDNNEIPRQTLRDLPGKVSALDQRITALEKRMWLIQIIGALISGILASFGKEIIGKLFH